MGEQQLVLELEQHQQHQDQGGGLLVHQPAYPPEQNTMQHKHISHHENRIEGAERENRRIQRTHNRHSLRSIYSSLCIQLSLHKRTAFGKVVYE